MKTAESRDAMVALVQATYADFPSFVALPQTKDPAWTTRVTVVNPMDNSSYVEALHKFCANGVQPKGRDGNDLVG